MSKHYESVAEPAHFGKEKYAILHDLSVACSLTKTDRRALAEHLRRADRVGTGVYVMLGRLLSQKLLYAPVVEENMNSRTIAASGSRVTYAIDDLGPQSGCLFHGEEYAPGQYGVHVASLLGGTLIGMKAGTHAPFLQADGSFRSVRLLSVDFQPPT